ncbi:hypothetical protein BDW66DRAFT_136762 [Aspergillus desertorum]
MKSHILTLALAACLSSVIAQSLPGLPACAQDCANGAIPSKCSPVDVECICATRSFVDDMACCVGKSCNGDDQKTALDFANGICGGAGVSDLPQSATCASDATTTPTATATATVTTTEATTIDGETTTTAGSTEAVTTTTGVDETTSKTSTETDTSTQTSTSTETETPANPEETDGAILLRSNHGGVLAGIIAGVAFML